MNLSYVDLHCHSTASDGTCRRPRWCSWPAAAG